MNSKWFQHDGATPHFANETLMMFAETFAGRIILRKITKDWPTHSPELNLCDFFPVGINKEQIVSSQNVVGIETTNVASCQRHHSRYVSATVVPSTALSGVFS